MHSLAEPFEQARKSWVGPLAFAGPADRARPAGVRAAIATADTFVESFKGFPLESNVWNYERKQEIRCRSRPLQLVADREARPLRPPGTAATTSGKRCPEGDNAVTWRVGVSGISASCRGKVGGIVSGRALHRRWRRGGGAGRRVGSRSVPGGGGAAACQLGVAQPAQHHFAKGPLRWSCSSVPANPPPWWR